MEEISFHERKNISFRHRLRPILEESTHHERNLGGQRTFSILCLPLNKLKNGKISSPTLNASVTNYVNDLEFVDSVELIFSSFDFR